MNDPVKQGLAAYLAYYENLTLDSVDSLRDIADENIRFRDPFNEVHGVEKVIHIMSDMFRDTINPKFEMGEIFQDGLRVAMRWDFTFTPTRLPKSGIWKIDGMSYLQFNEAGKVTEHLDYWDAAEQFYEKIPVLGFLIRLIKKRLTVHD